MRALADLVARWRTPQPEPAQLPADQGACVLCGAATADMEAFAFKGVCERCGFHHAISARTRIRLLSDAETFRETRASTTAIDPLSFADGGAYKRQLRDAFRRTALREAALTGVCRLHGRPVMLVVLDFGFMGGSMGVVVGERVAQAFEDAAKDKLPLISVISSSGMRMREGLLALSQMAKTAAAARRHHDRGLAHFSIFANPSTGGVFASFANLADVIIGEPGALMGYASLRAIEENEGAPLPPHAHSAESHLEHGLIDQVIGRDRQRELLGALIDLTSPPYRLEIARPLEPFRQRAQRQLSPWHEVALARHARRPSALGYIGRMTTSFVEIHGDRSSGDDPTVVAGFADLGGEAVMIVGQQRPENGAEQPSRIGAEGVRKATRALRLAEKFSLPVLTLIDTQGAARTRQAEERGIGHAIAENLAAMSALRTPIVAAVIGEGGSGAALAFGLADRVLMLEHAIFSVVSPEDAAAALYRDAQRADQMAGALRLTVQDAVELGLVDHVVPEPPGGAHEDHDAAAAMLKSAVLQQLGDLRRTGTSRLLKRRYAKYRHTPGYQNFFRVSLERNLSDLRASLRGRLHRALHRALPRRSPAPPADSDDDAGDIPIP